MPIQRLPNWQIPNIKTAEDDPESIREIAEWLRIHHIEHDEESANVALDFEKLVVDTIYPTNVESTTITTTNVTVSGSTTLSGSTANRLLSTDVSKIAVSTDLFAWVAGTTNRVSVADDLDGTITLSLPQDIHTGASPTFVTAKLSGLTDGYVPYHVADATGLANSDIYYSGTDVSVFKDATSGENPLLKVHGYVTAGTAARYSSLTMNDTNDEFLIQSENNANHEGITIDLTETNQKFRIRQNSDYLSINIDGTDPYIHWNDGILWFQTDEGTNTRTECGLKGKGNLGSLFYFYGPNDDYATWQKGNMWFAVESGQASGDVLIFNPHNNNNVELFSALGTTTSPEMRIAGYVAAGSAIRYTAMTTDNASGEFLIKPENNANHEGVTIDLTKTNQRFRIRQGSNLIAMHHDKIGIETASPEGNIDIIGVTGGTLTTLGSETFGLIIQQRLSNDLDDGFGPTVSFWTSNDQSDTWQVGAIEATSQSGWGGALRFYTPDGGSTNAAGRRTKGSSLIERLKIDNAGDVSIKTSNAELRFYEGANYVGFEAPALSTNQIWVLPDADGPANEVWGTDNSGNLIWRDHGEIAGLGDDDHTIYSLADGTRAFTGVVGGISPTAHPHLATKEYVDDAIGDVLDYHFNNTASDIDQESETTYDMVDIIYSGEENITRTAITATSNQLLYCFATLSGQPGGIDLPLGTYDSHLHLEVTGVGARTVDVYWTLSSIDDDGTNEVLLMTSETEAEVSGGETAYTLHAVLGSDVTLGSASRLLFKLYGSGNAGNNATMEFHVEGDSGTHISIKVSSTIFNTIYVRQDGSTPLTANWDIGNYTLTAAGLIIADGGNIGSASDPDAMQIEADGDIVMTQDLAVTGTLDCGYLTVTDTNEAIAIIGGATGDANRTWIAFYDSNIARKGYVGDASDDNDDIYLASDTGDIQLIAGGGNVLITGAVSATTVDIGSTIAVTGTLDEDNMVSDSAVKICTQQSIKAYADTKLSDVIDDTSPGAGGEFDFGAHTAGFTQQSATGDGTTTIDWKLGNFFFFTYGAQNDVFTFTAPSNPSNLILFLKQDSTGSRTPSWPLIVFWPTNYTEPTWSTGANTVDMVRFYYDGTNYYGYDAELDFANQSAVDYFEYATDVLAQAAYPTNGFHAITFEVTAQLDTAEKKWNSASLLLDGNSDFLSIPDSPNWDIVASNSDDWTIDFWVKHTDHVSRETYFDHFEDGLNYWRFEHTHGAGFRFFVVIADSLIIDTGYAGEITDTDWHHVALIKVGSDYGCYLDGTQTNHTDDASIDTLTGNLYIGARGDTVNFFDGHMDEIRIVHSNIFGAAPNNVPDDTFTLPTEAHETQTATKLLLHLDGDDAATSTVDGSRLDDYSESSIKNQGSYSLKGFAKQTDSLNDTLTRTVSPTIDLTGINTIKFNLYSSRTGANIKVGIHDSGGTTSEKTHTQAGAGAWETVTWDISGVSNANKDAIDSIIITIVNADADNTFYIDNMYTI